MNSLYKKGMISAAVLTSLLLLSIPMAYAQLPQIFIEPSHSDVGMVGQTFSVEVWLNVSQANVTNLFGWQVKVGFNTTILNATNAGLMPGHPHEGLDTMFSRLVYNADGYILVVSSLIDFGQSVNVTENKPFCYINFTSTAEGNSSLTQLDIDAVGGTYMLDNTGTRIPLEGVDGDVTVVPEFASIMVLALMTSITAALVLLRKRWSNFPTK